MDLKKKVADSIRLGTPNISNNLLLKKFYYNQSFHY